MTKVFQNSLNLKSKQISILRVLLLGILICCSCYYYLCNSHVINDLQIRWSPVIENEISVVNQFIEDSKIEDVLLELQKAANDSKSISYFQVNDIDNFSVCNSIKPSNNCLNIDSLKELTTLHIKKKSKDDVLTFACLSFNKNQELFFSTAISEKFYPDGISINFEHDLESVDKKFSEADLKLQLIDQDKSTYTVPHIASMESFHQKLRNLKENFSDSYQFDSLLMIIKDSEDISYKSKGDFKKLTNKLQAFSESQKSASVYLILKDVAGSKYFSIFTFGADRFLNLENPILLAKTYQIEIEDLICTKYRYTPSTYFFNWGDIALSVKQDNKGNFKAKSSIPYSTWYEAIGQKPNLLINNGDSIVEEFSLQVRLEKQYNAASSGIDFGEFNSLENNLKAISGKKDTMDALKQNAIGSTLLLSDFVFFDELKENITLELEITEDISLEQRKRFQFNWKHIDTVITKEASQEDYEVCLKMRKKEFIECLPFEPVLTSSKDGVIWDYSFDILKQGKDTQIFLENVACSIKNPKLYKGTKFDEDFVSSLMPDDVVILRNFKAAEIQENLTIYIEIEEDLDEHEEISSKEIYINWGKSKFRATDLSSDKTKKFYSDQIITKEKLLSISDENLYLIKNDKKEIVEQADLIITNKKEAKSCQKNNSWNYCLAELISGAEVGDHINIFLRSKSGQSALMQFYIEQADTKADILGYGVRSDFDTLLFKYAEPIYKKKTSKLSQFNLKWGTKVDLPLKLISNPNIYSVTKTMLNKDFINNLGNEISIQTEAQEIIQIREGYLLMTPANPMYDETSKDEINNYNSFLSRRIRLNLNCSKGKCSINSEDLNKALEKFDGIVNGASLYFTEYAKDNIDGKLNHFNFIIENPEGPWIPKETMKRYSKFEDHYEFQFVYNYNGKSILKLDVENPEYSWMVDKYKSDPTVQIKNFPKFKTIERTINQADGIVKKEKLKHVEVLSDNFKSIHDYPDFYDFSDGKPQLMWKSYLANKRAETYCLEDFICSEGELSLSIREKNINIYRGELLIVSPNGDAIKYVFDDINDFEIEKRLKRLNKNSSLYFTNILVETNDGNIHRFPVSFAYHLE